MLCPNSSLLRAAVLRFWLPLYGLIGILGSAPDAAAGAPTFAAVVPVNTAPRADNMVMGDFDGDGVPDVAVYDANTGKV
jgi:hypothetical protein